MQNTNNTLEYIEDYFTQALTDVQRKEFEARIVQDAAFAREVAFYITARSAAHELMMERKQSAPVEKEIIPVETVRQPRVRRMPVSRLLAYAAAACIILFIGAYFLFSSPAPQQLAAQYVKENYAALHPTLDASRDSMQLGIAAYNAENYRQAVSYFEGIRQRDPSNDEAKRYAGLAYLQAKNYDEALECFKELSAMKLHYNSGDFWQAITLLQRNSAGDKEAAKALLEKVVQQDEDGSDGAHELLEKWK